MKQLTNKKKYVAAAILVSALAFTITQSATARQNQWNNQTTPYIAQQVDPVIQKAKEKFMAETVELRKQMAQKRAAMNAVMAADTPDPKKASQLAGELFELQEQMRLMAQEYGLPTRGMGRHGLSGCSGGQGKGKGLNR